MALPSQQPLDVTFEVELPPAPYPGLRPFNLEEWPIFFGREQMTDEVVGRVIRQHLVVVHGDSGCGKSSLVRAGVLAQLEHERARSGVRWRTAVMLPREAPLQRLAEAIAELQGAADDSVDGHRIRGILNRGADAPPALAEVLRGASDDHVCILVDQFEELFAFARQHGREEAELFVDILVGLQKKPPPGLYVILTMRSEFLGVCARFTGLAEVVNKTQYLVPQMEPPALLRAICEPAPLYDGEVSRALAERLIVDAGGHQDQLPLIQQGLMLLSRRKRRSPTPDAGPEPYPFSGPAEAPARYEIDEAPGSYRHGAGPTWRLGLDDYRGGDLAALLSDHADRVMAAAALDPHRQNIVEHLFRALTDINAEGQTIRRPRTLAQLVTVTGSDEETLKDIVDSFRAEGVSFLRPYGDRPIELDNEIDISHEALARCWEKIADRKDGWLQHEFRDGLIWKSLRLSAEEGETLPPLATSTRDAWLEGLPSSAWCERYGGGWADVQWLMIRSRQARDEEARRRQDLEAVRQREAAEHARQAEEARQAAKLAAKQQEVLEAQERIAAEQRQRAEAEQQRAAEAEARARDADAGRRRSKRMALFAGSLALVALCAAVAAGWFWAKASNEQLKATQAFQEATAERQRAQLANSHFRAEQARNQLSAGFPITAMQLALAGLPEDPAELWGLPWFAETAGALAEALGDRRELKELSGHEGPVWAAAFSPDGTRIVSGSDDHTVRVWDLANGVELGVLRAHEGPVLAAGFSPDGTRIVSGSSDQTVRVWDVASGAELLVLRGHEGGVKAAEFSRDGTRIVSGSDDQTVRVWDAASGAELLVLRRHRGPVSAVGFSPDGKRIVSGSWDNTARVWDAASGEQLLTLSGHEGGVKAAAFSPDGRRIVTANGIKPAVGEGNRGGGGGKIYVWDAEGGQLSRDFQLNSEIIRAASFSPDGRRVLSGSDDGMARIWDVATGEQLDVLAGRHGSLYAARLSPDQSRIVAGSGDGTILLWDRTGDAERTWVFRGHTAVVNMAGFSRDGAHIVSGSADRTARVWDAASGEQLLVLRGHQGSVLAVAFSPDGTRIVSGSLDNTARVWDAASGQQLLVLRGHQADVWAVGFSPDGARIVTGSEDNTIRVWDAASGEQLLVLRGHEGLVTWAAFSPNGARIVSGSADKTIRVWSAKSGREQRVLRGHEGAVSWTALSPDGARIVSGSADKTARVWDAVSGEQLLALHGHEGIVNAVGFAPDGARIVSGSWDGTARVWDAASGEQLLVLRGPGQAVLAAGFAPDGARILTGSMDGTIRVTWIGHSKQELIETARARLPRELTEDEKRRFYLMAQ